MEIIVSITIIALLLGLAVMGMRHAIALAKGTVGHTMVENVATGIVKFKEKVGFIPPLVRERVGIMPPAVPNINTAYVLTPGAARNLVRIYEPANPTHQQELNTLVAMGAVNNPFEDETRYSEASLAYFLVGALDHPYGGNATSLTLPIDGVRGPGMFPPDRNGKFGVPSEIVNPADPANPPNVGNPLESFVNLGSGGIKLAFLAGGDARTVRLADKANVALRYYRWINGNQYPPITPTTPLEVRSLDDLKIPRMVGRFTVDPSAPVVNETIFPTPPDRDIRQNPALRTATWAVVGAGTNGVFGDEDLAIIAAALGQSLAAGEVKLRSDAEKDNIVRVGNE